MSPIIKKKANSKRRCANISSFIVFYVALAIMALLTAIMLAMGAAATNALYASLCCFWICFAALVSIEYVRDWKSKPDYITKHGTAVWTNGNHDITPAIMEQAMEVFIDAMEVEQDLVSRQEIEHLYARLDIEWDEHPITIRVDDYALKNKRGVQSGYILWLKWPGSLAESAFYHELLHAINEIIRMPKLPEHEQSAFRLKDLKHEEPEWWRLEGVIDAP